MTTGPPAADDAPRIPTAPPRRRPTMKDIAERAGVSPSAVSFALNDRDGVSPATRARIREVAEELGWQPNSAARALSGERSGCVGLVLARPARTLGVESFFLQLVSGIQEALAAQRVALLFQVVEDLDAECATYRRWWAERRVDGVLVVDPRTEDPRPALLASLTLPTVVIGNPQPAPTTITAPDSVSVSVSASASASETSPGPASVPGAGPEPAPVPGTGPDPTPVPGTGPGVSQGPAPVPGAGPDATPIPGASPGPAPRPDLDLAPVPNPGLAPNPDWSPAPTSSSGPSPDQSPASVPSGLTLSPGPHLASSPASAPCPDRGPAPSSGLTPDPSRNLTPSLAPSPSPSPSPNQGTSPALSPSPLSAPSPLSTIWADDAAAMRSIIDHLHALGHRRIVHIAGLPGLAHTERRVAALRAEAARLGLDAADVRSVCTDYSDEQGAEATRRLLATPRPPTAIVYDNDVMAVAGAAVAAERGVPVPGALSIVAWDDSPLCRVTHPRLTSLVRDTAGFGRLAAQELLSLLDGAPTRRLQAELPHLELRESTTRAP